MTVPRRVTLRSSAFQYLFIGASISLFYLLLLATSEHVAFHLAYLFGAVGTVASIAGYGAAILRNYRQGLLVGMLMAALYGFLYVVVIADEFALLLGSAGLFLLLALVMFVTRRVDWYALGGEKH